MKKRLAICIGLTRVDPTAYKGWEGLCPGADRDAARMAQLFHDRGFDGVTVLVNEAATKQGVKYAFLSALKSLKSGDLLVLFASGHGGQQPDKNGDEPDGRDETLCWFDGEVIDDQLGSYLAMLPSGVRVWSIADTCNSGTNYRGVRRKKSTPVSLGRKQLAALKGSLLHFGGCADGRSSFGKDEGGAFTLAILAALAEAAKTPSYDALFAEIKKKLGRQQVPVVSSWGQPAFSKQEAAT